MSEAKKGKLWQKKKNIEKSLTAGFFLEVFKTETFMGFLFLKFEILFQLVLRKLVIFMLNHKKN